jgi:pilus assembly protein Flp/PilA
MATFIQSFFRDQTGATAIEYGLIAALVAIAAMGGMSLLGTSLNSIFTNVGSTLQNPTGS